MKVVTLTQMNEKRETHLDIFGLMNQTIFETVSDALDHIFITTPISSTISIERTSDMFAWITIDNPIENKYKYFELRIVEPLSFVKINNN